MRVTTLISALCIAFLSQAQLKQFNTPASFGMQLKSNGFGFSFNKEIVQKGTTLWGLESSISYLKHNKEAKVRSTAIPNPTPYVFGKVNRAIQWNNSITYAKRIGAPRNSSPGIQFGIEAGPTFAITRPVYVEFHGVDITSLQGASIRKYDRHVHENQVFIKGDAGWNKGFSEMQLTPGVHSTVFVEFDRFSEVTFQRFKLGFAVDYYPQSIELLYDANNQLFSSVQLIYLFAGSH